MMFAVFKSGGKQHRVTEGEVVRLEKIDAELGAAVEFDEVLMVAEGDDVKIGAPFLSGSKVTGEIVGHDRHDKIRIVKFRRRKHYMRTAGHRQWYTDVRITGIKG
jgi:large subunit ribosomal protein L21